ncbi:MAG: hypothetical protein JSU03_12015 [Bacteroidetes bacterium]|nr:hypothetical protein [Bacteroidota bacterium]MBS1757994.1 hypothetical protein [Bacteroidota bacterium]
MKNLKIIYSAILLVVILFASGCSNSSIKTSENNISESNSSNSTQASNSLSDNEGSYSFSVNGNVVNEKGSLMEGYKANVNKSDNTLSLILTNASATDGSVSTFAFEVPIKTGSCTFTKENDIINDTAYMCTYTGATGHGADVKIDPHVNSITISVDQLSDTRVSGTFSGTVIAEDGKTLLPVTNGKFNLPIFVLK